MRLPSGQGRNRIGRRAKVYSLDNDSVLADERGQQLCELNRAAAFFWDCLEDGLDHDTVLTRLVHAASFAAGVSESLVSDALTQWTRNKLIGADVANSPDAGAPSDFDGHPTIARASRAHLRNSHACFSIVGLSIRLHCPDEAVRRRVVSTLAHLSTPSHAAVSIDIDVIAFPSGFEVLDDGYVLARVHSLEGLAC